MIFNDDLYDEFVSTGMILWSKISFRRILSIDRIILPYHICYIHSCKRAHLSCTGIRS